MLFALYSVFNAQDLLAESVRSVAPQVDEIHVYDGRYEGFKCYCGRDHENSCDQTAEVVEEVKKELEIQIKYIELPVMSEVEKRTKTFERLAKGDVGLVIDDDELFYGSQIEMRFFGFSKKYNIGWINVLGSEHSRRPFMKLFLKVKGMKFVSSERGSYEVHDENGFLPELNTNETGSSYEKRCTLKLCGLVHLSGTASGAYGSLERVRARATYEKYLKDRLG